MMVRWLSLFLASTLVACGASGGSRLSSPRAPREIDVPKLLLELGRERTTLLRPPVDSIETLEGKLRQARGEERRAVLRELAVAHLFAAENALGDREAKTERRKAKGRANDAITGNKSRELAAEMAFVELFTAYRSAQKSAGRSAARFVERHPEPKELHLLAWIVRGEIALAGGKFEEALASYRYLLVQLDHPLYALALYRTAHAYRGLERTSDAKQALEEARQLACARDASPSTLRIGAVAARELGSPLREEEDGTFRPANCPIEPPIQPD